MSKIGRKKIFFYEKNHILVESSNLRIAGPLGCLSIELYSCLHIIQKNNFIFLDINSVSYKNSSLLGLFRTLISNMILGVNYGYTRKVEVNGIGYKVYHNSNFLVFVLGYSHDIIYHLPLSVTVRCVSNVVEIFSCDKYLVSRVCLDIINLKRLEQYKGKGIRYFNEKFLKRIGKKK